MPFTIVTLIVGSVTVLFALMLAIVVIGIRREPLLEELGERAPNLIAAFTRRLLGVYVRKPDSPPNPEHGVNGHASPRVTPLVGPTDKRRR